ncbi:MAG: NUDIX domain-containing protein [Cyclobacteriaceae bacterium]
MRIYINDIPVKITDKKHTRKSYNIELSDQNEEISINKLKGRVLIRNKNKEAIDNLLKIMTKKRHEKIKKILIEVNNKEKSVEYLKSKFDIVEAGGGIVGKDHKILMIFRKGKWDLPKGKLEIGETKKEGSIREVEEETGVKVKLHGKIGATWHTYLRNNKYVLKRTYWYAMDCKDDSKIKPQKSEGIEEVRWMNKSEVEIAMTNTYATIEHVIISYFDNLELQKKRIKIKPVQKVYGFK